MELESQPETDGEGWLYSVSENARTFCDDYTQQCSLSRVRVAEENIC